MFVVLAQDGTGGGNVWIGRVQTVTADDCGFMRVHLVSGAEVPRAEWLRLFLPSERDRAVRYPLQSARGAAFAYAAIPGTPPGTGLRAELPDYFVSEPQDVQLSRVDLLLPIAGAARRAALCAIFGEPE